MTYPIKFVTIEKASDLMGYSQRAIQGKRTDGIWLQDIHWVKAPDGRILINLEEIEKWIQGKKVGLEA